MSIQIQYMSDLHLEFERPRILERGDQLDPPEVVGDVLVLAGDIHIGTQGADWINRCAKKFKDVVVLFGNHEFYHNDMDTVRSKLVDLVDRNVHILDNGYVDIDGVRIIGTTLWTDMSSRAWYSMNDSRIIADGEEALSLDKVREMWRDNVQFIKASLSTQLVNVVTTHHAPTLEMIDMTRYGVDYMTSGYATEILDEFDTFPRIDLWISGHTHAVMDREVGGVRCVSNCRGYVGYDEVVGFDPLATVEVG